MSGFMEIIKVRNNNPGTAPDYTENDVITLRRYNGEPLNHTQADDNLELLRRGLIAAGDNITTVDNRITNVTTNLGDFINQKFINSLVKNQNFENEISKYFSENITNLMQEFFEDNRTFTVDGRTFTTFEEYLSEIVNQNFNSYFDTYLTEYGDTFLEQINVQQFVDDSINNTFNAPDNIFQQYITNQINQITQTVDLESLLKELQSYVDQSINPLNVRINALDALLNGLFDLLENLNIGDGTVDLSEVTKSINALSRMFAAFLNGTCFENSDGEQDCTFQKENNNFADIAQLAQDNEKRLDDIDQALKDIVDAINDLGKSLQELSDAVKKGFEELEEWITGVFKDITNALADLAEQIENNAEQIVDLWEEFGNLAQALWNQIGFLWAELGTAFSKLKDIEEEMCEIDLKVDALQTWCGSIGEVNMTFCEDGKEVSENFAIFPSPAMDNMDPTPTDAQLAACGGPVFDALVAEGKLKKKDANKLGRDALNTNRKKRQEMKKFVRARDARKAFNQAVNKGFTLPDIADFIHQKLTL